MQNKRGQVTLFIIVGILIVVSILLYLLVLKPQISPTPGAARLSGFEGCVQEVIESELPGLAKHAGLENSGFSYQYRDQKMTYLCYTNQYYRQCTTIVPFLVQSFENSLEKSARTGIENCYKSSVDDLRKRGYDVLEGNINITAAIDPERITATVIAPTTVSKESSATFAKFDAAWSSPLYTMLMVATSILQQETRYGDSDTTAMMIYYPDFAIDKLRQGDGTNIYIITDSKTKLTFQFAVRSLVYPAGYGLTSGLLPEAPSTI